MRKLLLKSSAAVVLAGSLGWGGAAHATYATLPAPVGWSPGVGAAATYSTGVSAAQEASIALARINANAALTVGGRSVAIPVTMPIVKEGIKKAAATAIFLNPALRTAAAVATWLGAAGLAYDVASGLWKKPDNSYSTSDGYYYWAQAVPYVSVQERFQTADALCQKALAGFKANNTSDWSWTLVQCDAGLRKMEIDGFYKGGAANPYRYDFNRSVDSSCPAGWYVTPAGCVQTQPMQTVDKDKFVEILQPDPRVDTDGLPNIVWPGTWPVQNPVIQPTYVPTGNPVPNPNYDPAKLPSTENQPYVQPGVRVEPAPTPSNPWQVDVVPVNRPMPSPTASPDPVALPAPTTNPDGTPAPDPTGDKQRAPDPEKVITCGLPDTPACKIDEKGTPDKVEDTAKDDAEKVHKPLDDFLKDPKSALPKLPEINWTFRLPSGCAPIALPAFAPFLQQIDVCQFQPMFHDIMSIIWVGGALFGAIGTFWRNVFAKAG